VRPPGGPEAGFEATLEAEGAVSALRVLARSLWALAARHEEVGDRAGARALGHEAGAVDRLARQLARDRILRSRIA
jgi:hypothetical protein